MQHELHGVPLPIVTSCHLDPNTSYRPCHMPSAWQVHARYTVSHRCHAPHPSPVVRETRWLVPRPPQSVARLLRRPILNDDEEAGLHHVIVQLLLRRLLRGLNEITGPSGSG